MNGEDVSCAPIVQHEERRHKPFTQEELEAIKDQILDSIYADIGRSVTKKVLWIFGAVVLALFAWLAGSGHIKMGS